MDMNVKDELRQIAKKHRWAFEELTFDLCMKAANYLDGKYKEQFAYLKTRFGSGYRVLNEAMKEFAFLKVSPPIGTPKERWRIIVRSYPWGA